MFVLPLLAALAGDVAILDVSVQRESHDEVELAIAYRLTGVREEAHVGAITMFGGSSALHWAYSPATLELGTHSAVVTVKRGPDAPPVYHSDAFKIQVFGGLDHEHDFPYDKLWCDQAACDDSLLVEVQSAPLEERLTSIFPSIRVAAEAEAETLDDEAKRALMPGITERIRHTNVWIRLRALRVLGDWGLNDPALTVRLSKRCPIRIPACPGRQRRSPGKRPTRWIRWWRMRYRERCTRPTSPRGTTQKRA